MAVARLIKFYRQIDLVTVKQIVARVMEYRLMGSSSEMAFHAMLAIFPGILIVIAALSRFQSLLKPGLVELVKLLKGIVPLEVWTLLFNFVKDFELSQGQNWFPPSLIAGIWIFSGVLSAATNVLDQIHEISSKEKRPFWKARLINILYLLGQFFY